MPNSLSCKRRRCKKDTSFRGYLPLPGQTFQGSFYEMGANNLFTYCPTSELVIYTRSDVKIKLKTCTVSATTVPKCGDWQPARLGSANERRLMAFEILKPSGCALYRHGSLRRVVQPGRTQGHCQRRQCCCAQLCALPEDFRRSSVRTGARASVFTLRDDKERASSPQPSAARLSGCPRSMTT